MKLIALILLSVGICAVQGQTNRVAPAPLPPGYAAVAHAQKKLDDLNAAMKRAHEAFKETSQRNDLIEKAGGQTNQRQIRKDYAARTEQMRKQQAALELEIYDLRKLYKIPDTWPPKKP